MHTYFKFFLNFRLQVFILHHSVSFARKKTNKHDGFDWRIRRQRNSRRQHHQYQKSAPIPMGTMVPVPSNSRVWMNFLFCIFCDQDQWMKRLTDRLSWSHRSILIIYVLGFVYHATVPLFLSEMCKFLFILILVLHAAESIYALLIIYSTRAMINVMKVNPMQLLVGGQNAQRSTMGQSGRDTLLWMMQTFLVGFLSLGLLKKQREKAMSAANEDKGNNNGIHTGGVRRMNSAPRQRVKSHFN